MIFFLSFAIPLAILAIWGNMALWFRRRRRGGTLLLDLGRSKAQIVSGIILGGLFALFGIRLLTKTPAEVYSLSLAVMMLSISISNLLGGLSRSEVREYGILIFPFFVKWEWIESYEWGGRRGHTLILRLRRRWGRKVRLPGGHKESTEHVLAQYLPFGGRRDGEAVVSKEE